MIKPPSFSALSKRLSLAQAHRVQIATCYLSGISVIMARIFGVPIPVARSYPGVVGYTPLLLVVCPIPVMSLKYAR